MNKKSLGFYLAAILFLLSGFQVNSQQSSDSASLTKSLTERASWLIDRNHSEVNFSVRHLAISKVRGEFTSFSAAIEFDESDLNTLSVTATIDVESIDTGVQQRDNHLRSGDFFDAETYAQILFVSKAVRNVDGTEFELVGDLTMKDVTKEIVLSGSFLGAIATQNGRKAGFELSGSVDRFDYHLNWDRLTEAGGLVAGRDITISLNMELNQEME